MGEAEMRASEPFRDLYELLDLEPVMGADGRLIGLRDKPRWWQRLLGIKGRLHTREDFWPPEVEVD